MENKTEEKLKHRKIAALLLVAGILVLLFIVTPNADDALLQHAGIAAALFLFPASVYFNYKAREENTFTLPQKQLIAILVSFLVLAAGLLFLR